MEIKRRFDTIDMMLTMHSKLRDRLNVIALSLDGFRLCISTILCATIFLDSDYLLVLGINPGIAKILIGSISVAILIISIISLRFDWKGTAEKHNQAINYLSTLKHKFHMMKGQENPDPMVIEKLFLEYDQKMSEIVAIPEKYFNKLKHYHNKKVALSKLISKYPGCPLFLIRWILYFSSSKTLIEDRRNYYA